MLVVWYPLGMYLYDIYVIHVTDSVMWNDILLIHWDGANQDKQSAALLAVPSIHTNLRLNSCKVRDQ